MNIIYNKLVKQLPALELGIILGDLSKLQSLEDIFADFHLRFVIDSNGRFHIFTMLGNGSIVSTTYLTATLVPQLLKQPFITIRSILTRMNLLPKDIQFTYKANKQRLRTLAGLELGDRVSCSLYRSRKTFKLNNVVLSDRFLAAKWVAVNLMFDGKQEQLFNQCLNTFDLAPLIADIIDSFTAQAHLTNSMSPSAAIRLLNQSSAQAA
jgi:hypothetical protein